MYRPSVLRYLIVYYASNISPSKQHVVFAIDSRLTVPSSECWASRINNAKACSVLNLAYKLLRCLARGRSKNARISEEFTIFVYFDNNVFTNYVLFYTAYFV